MDMLLLISLLAMSVVLIVDRIQKHPAFVHLHIINSRHHTKGI